MVARVAPSTASAGQVRCSFHQKGIHALLRAKARITVSSIAHYLPESPVFCLAETIVLAARSPFS